MKKIFVALFALLFALTGAFGVPASTKPIKFVQPDGTVIMLQKHGDEFHHWTTCNGVKVTRCEDGFWREVPGVKSSIPSGLSSSGMQRKPQRAAGSSITKGEKRFLVILVEFKDLEMLHTNDEFNRMLNQEGYSDNGAYGSARDYFLDNSLGVFQPKFDVVGPVKLEKSYSYYGENNTGDDTSDKYAYEAVIDACRALDATVNFADYDLDNDGFVDNIFMYYAGYNEAESDDEKTIWPHRWWIYSGAGKTVALDGVKLDNYACTSEMYGYTGGRMCGIGVFCHEFSHVLGLPDLYDTDYEKNGLSDNVLSWSLMGNGNYLNEGRTPPFYCAVERETVGWLPSILAFDKSGSYVLEPVWENKAYFSPTSVSGETFIYEVRGGESWDTFLPAGMIVYHKDASARDVHGRSAAQRWLSWDGINAYADHPCFYIVPAGRSAKVAENCPFPQDNVRSFCGVDWDGKKSLYQLSNIRTSGSSITFNLDINRSGHTLSGTVYDNYGNPIEGADVTLTVKTEDKAPARTQMFRVRSLRAPEGGKSYSASVSADGSYSIDLGDEAATDFVLTASCRGFISFSKDIHLVESGTEDIVLNAVNYKGLTSYSLYKFSPRTLEEGTYVLSFNNPIKDYSVGLKYTAAELKDYIGARVDSILFASPAEKIEKAEVVIDRDSKNDNILRVDATDAFVSNGYTRVGIADKNITVTGKENLIFGYSLTGAENAKNECALMSTDKTTGGLMLWYDSFDWQDLGKEFGTALIIVKLAKTKRAADSALINYISNPGRGHYKAGEVFPLSIVESEDNAPSAVSWKFDGAAVEAAPVTLTAGEHVVEAELTYKDGSKECLQQYILAE